MKPPRYYIKTNSNNKTLKNVENYYEYLFDFLKNPTIKNSILIEYFEDDIKYLDFLIIEYKDKSFLRRSRKDIAEMINVLNFISATVNDNFTEIKSYVFEELHRKKIEKRKEKFFRIGVFELNENDI